MNSKDLKKTAQMRPIAAVAGGDGLPPKPSHLLDDVRAILRDARGQAYTAANAAMVDAYWRIGRRIVEEEQGGAARAGYGSQLISHLARSLGEEFGQGMSVANLKNFRQFYLTFADAGKRYALRSELSWTHWRLVMRVENPQARDYYIEETARPPAMDFTGTGAGHRDPQLRATAPDTRTRHTGHSKDQPASPSEGPLHPRIPRLVAARCARRTPARRCPHHPPARLSHGTWQRLLVRGPPVSH